MVRFDSIMCTIRAMETCARNNARMAGRYRARAKSEDGWEIAIRERHVMARCERDWARLLRQSLVEDGVSRCR